MIYYLMTMALFDVPRDFKDKEDLKFIMLMFEVCRRRLQRTIGEMDIAALVMYGLTGLSVNFLVSMDLSA